MKKLLSFLFFLMALHLPLSAQEAQNPPAITSYDEWKSETQELEKPAESSFGKIFMRMILLLLITVAGLVAFAWLAKRFLASRQLIQNRQSRIQLLERRPLTPKTALVLISIDGKELLIAETQTGITLVKDLKEIS